MGEHSFSHLLVSTNKRNRLIQSMIDSVDKRRTYELIIATCYINLTPTIYFLKEILNYINISKVNIFFDRKEAVRIGKDILISWINRHSEEIEIKINPVSESSYLFHSKAYALISHDSNSIIDGCLFVGSANLTKAGLTGQSGNNETLMGTNELSIIEDFLSSLRTIEKKIVNINEIEYFEKTDSLEFKYSLLNCGYFIYGWSDDIKRELAIRLHLSEFGKNQISDETFTDLEFNLDQATISKRYFDISMAQYDLPDLKKVKRRYGIETYLGYWVPKSAITWWFSDAYFENFKDSIKNKIDYQVDGVKEKLKSDIAILYEKGLIEEDYNDDFFESITERITNIFEDDIKLWRLYSKYETIDLPYDIAQKEEIENLFDNLLESIEKRKKKNDAMKVIDKAITENSISPILNMEVFYL